MGLCKLLGISLVAAREGACSVNVASDRLQTITTTLNGVSAVKERASTNLHLRAVPTIELYKGCQAHHQ